jgi:hypothetical protein
VRYSYALTGTGWAKAHLANDEMETTIPASYLSDSLGDLLEAVGVLLEGAVEARCSWDVEPGEYRWLFDRSGPDVRVRVLAFPELWGKAPDDAGTLVFETREPLRALASAVLEGALAVLDQYGEEKYKARWVEHPFPTAHLELIRQRLASL